MANPFTPPSDDEAPLASAPADSPNPDVDPDVGPEVASLVIGMRFPQLLFGGLYGLMALATMAVGGLGFLAGLGAGPDERLLLLGGSSVYLVMGAVGLVPSGLLVRSGLAALLAGSAEDHEQSEHVLTSLRAQLWFWRVLALYLLLMTLLYGLAFFVLVGLGMLGNLG